MTKTNEEFDTLKNDSDEFNKINNQLSKEKLKKVVADTVVYGTIRTADIENPVVEAIAIKDGKFIYVVTKLM